MTNTNQQIASAIKREALKRGVTQVQLAKLWGVQQGQVSKILNGKFTVKADTLAKTAKFFKCSINNLFV